MPFGNDHAVETGFLRHLGLSDRRVEHVGGSVGSSHRLAVRTVVGVEHETDAHESSRLSAL
jgi:hypothetical protein